MSEGLMRGMFLAGALLSAIPIALFIAGGVWLFRRYLEERLPMADNESKEVAS